MSSLLRLECKQTENSSNPFRISIFFFLSYSSGIETIKTFIQSHSSLRNHTRFQKILPNGVAHTLIAYIREHPPAGRYNYFSIFKPRPNSCAGLGMTIGLSTNRCSQRKKTSLMTKNKTDWFRSLDLRLLQRFGVIQAESHFLLPDQEEDKTRLYSYGALRYISFNI